MLSQGCWTGSIPRVQSPVVLVLLLKTDTHHLKCIFGWEKQYSQLVNGTKVKRCKAELTLHNMHRECSVHITALYAHSDMTISNVLGLRLHKEAFKTVLGLTGNTLVGKIGTSLG